MKQTPLVAAIAGRGCSIRVNKSIRDIKDETPGGDSSVNKDLTRWMSYPWNTGVRCGVRVRGIRVKEGGSDNFDSTTVLQPGGVRRQQTIAAR